jgi:hypothetical protein
MGLDRPRHAAARTEWLAEQGIASQPAEQDQRRLGPTRMDLIKNHELALIFNTPTRKGMKSDEGKLRVPPPCATASPMITTTTGAAAAVQRHRRAASTGPGTVHARAGLLPAVQDRAEEAVRQKAGQFSGCDAVALPLTARTPPPSV